MGDHDFAKIAILATKEYLISLLQEEKWCTARQVGQALEILVNAKRDSILGRANIKEAAVGGK